MADYDFGLIGLAVMGQNLVLNIESRGYSVAVFNRTTSKMTAFVEERCQGKNIGGFEKIEDFVRALRQPRRIMLMVKAGEADALFSAGSSGATAISAIQYIGMVDGVYRPALVGSLGKFARNTVMVDLGANVDCKPDQFLTFAIAGSVYAKEFLGISDPKIALLSTGSEESKGNNVVREAYSLLKKSGLNFIGNIEGGDILSGKAHVIVCDGFVGNVLLKFLETIGPYAQVWTEEKLRKHPPLRALARLMFKGLFPATKMSGDSEKQGGGILWGVDGIVKIGHGASRAPQIANAIESAKEAAKAGVVATLKSELARFNQGGKS